MAEVKSMLKNDCGCRINQITTRNPQANAIPERIHQTIGNMMRTFQLPTSDDVDETNPFSGLLSAVAFATRATIHTTLGATPCQLVFGRDAMVNQTSEADWEQICARKQKLINQNNAKENAKRTPFEFKVGEQILLKTEQKTKFGRDPYEGPCTILQVNDNGTLKYQYKNVIDAINIRMVDPYKG